MLRRRGKGKDEQRGGKGRKERWGEGGGVERKGGGEGEGVGRREKGREEPSYLGFYISLKVYSRVKTKYGESHIQSPQN